MRRTLWCRGLPGSGEMVPEPAAEDILAHLRADPMLELGWYEGGRLIDQLLVVRHPNRGFHLEYSGRQPERWAVAVGPADGGDEWVPLLSHGQQAYFLARCFLPLAVAEQVAKEFLASGALSAPCQWIPFEDLRPRRDQPPG